MYPSPFMTCLLIIGIICLALAPPLGIVFIILAVAEQRRLNGSISRARWIALERHRKRQYDTGIRYFR